MPVKTLDHVNIRTPDVPATAAFFRDILGLEARAAPGAEHIDKGCWIHDPAGHPIIHIGPVKARYPSDDTTPFTAARGSGAVHHVALECDDLPDMLARLERAGRPVSRVDFDAANLVQLFVEEENGVLLELNFRSAAT
ncbi:catechol 2,3-dioxygenase-like lactoylglutathione lyase family enzyme [Sphingobium sp. OAS761]|uniref:VOC family protein n=1 Tax=Sphingobium sp. OAS761 TaxID=2817901 RepID=UPI0020A0D75E|nr:VOC family protein [Sphingobium sp. OAS761]MCP1470405.1 catechol 2,3-dioxygenase-like lactoylglutathione lyase family enzyme [Sphingobium sp. OAS761]